MGGYERKRGARRIFNRVEKELGSGEQLQAAVWAQRYIPGLQMLLLFGALGDTLYLILSRPYILALTDQGFTLYNSTRFAFVPKPRGAVYTVPADQVRLELGRKFVVRKVATVSVVGGQETRIAVHRQYWGELDYMASLLSGS